MKKKEKRMILILLAILVVTLIIFFVVRNKNGESKEGERIVINSVEQIEEKYVKVQEDGTKLNISDKLNQSKTVGGYTFSNIRFTEKDGETILLADVKNNTSSATPARFVDITLLNDNGQEIITISGIISPAQAGETVEFETSMTLDYANTYDLKIVLN